MILFVEGLQLPVQQLHGADGGAVLWEATTCLLIGHRMEQQQVTVLYFMYLPTGQQRSQSIKPFALKCWAQHTSRAHIAGRINSGLNREVGA
jgi:hypothetical protein